MDKINDFLGKKWPSRIFNIAYLLGWLISWELGVFEWYLIISTLIACILFWRPLWKIMQAGGKLYADWCMKISDKTVGKLNPWKEKK